MWSAINDDDNDNRIYDVGPGQGEREKERL